MVSQIRLRINLLGKGRRIRASMGRFAVFYVQKMGTQKDKILPILYSKNPTDLESKSFLKLLLNQEKNEGIRFHMNKICDRVIHQRKYYSEILREQEDFDFKDSNFVEIEINKQIKGGENDFSSE